MYKTFCLCVFIVILNSISSEAVLFLVVPEDVPAGFAAIYGFAPPITKGNDHRFGFGFRLGNHADFQILYEFGPQSVTRPLQPSISTPTIGQLPTRSDNCLFGGSFLFNGEVRSASYRQRFARRRPVFELLVRAGVLKRNSYDFNVIQDCDDEPR